MFKLKIPPILRKLAAANGVKLPQASNVNPEKGLASVTRSLKTKGAVHAFVVPPIGVSGATALAAGAKVIAQGKSSAQVIAHTRALAALGDKDAARGLAALTTAKVLAMSGKKVPPPPSQVKPMAFKKTYTQNEIDALVKNRPDAVSPNLWVKIKRWIGGLI